MANNDTIGKTVGVALALCVVCSIVVSTAAVVLRPAQEANKARDFKRNILQAAGLFEAGTSVEEQFSAVSTKAIDFDSGKFTDVIDIVGYDQQKAAKNPATSTKLSGDQDMAKIGSMENVGLVYMVEKDGQLDKLILPIKGYGLWSTLYGFMALESDGNTIVGLGFYQHGETPGLGGEVDNPNWKALWIGKEVYSADGSVAITITKGPAPVGDINKVDGLSGATLTSRGVNNLIHFWMGEDGYAGFLNNLKKGEA